MNPDKLAELTAETDKWIGESPAMASFASAMRPSLSIVSSDSVNKIQAAVSPDCSYRLLAAAIKEATEELCIYIYNLTSDDLLDLLKAARDRGVRLKIMYDAKDTNGDEVAKLEGLHVDLKVAPSSNGRKVFTVCHQKYAVIDRSILVLGSANWVRSAYPPLTQPGQFKKANREWVVRIDDRPTAQWFLDLFNMDWNIPVEERAALAEVEVPPEGAIASVSVPALLRNVPERVFDVRTMELASPVRVTPIISPDNYFDMVTQVILNARSSVDIEQQYILASGPKTQGILEALRTRKNDVEIRIIVSPAYRKEGAKDNWELSVEWLQSFDLQDRLRAMNLSYFTHLHNKGLIIDRERAIVSSTNWSENSVARAREAGVLIESPEVASYYAEVFDLDWSLAWPAEDVKTNLMSVFREAMFIPGGFGELHPADLV